MTHLIHTQDLPSTRTLTRKKLIRYDTGWHSRAVVALPPATARGSRETPLALRGRGEGVKLSETRLLWYIWST